MYQSGGGVEHRLKSAKLGRRRLSCSAVKTMTVHAPVMSRQFVIERCPCAQMPFVLPSRQSRERQVTYLLIELSTWDAGEAGLQVRHEIPLTRMHVDQVAQTDYAVPSTGALAVEVDDHILGATDVEVIVDASSESHPAIYS